MSTKWYLAGKMSGIPQCNFPLFQRVATVLRKQGYAVVSPVELDDESDYAIAMANKRSPKSWGDFLARDVKLLADGGITGIIFLPGWEDSDGAKLEATVGLLKKFKFMRWDEATSTPVPYSRMSVTCILHREFAR
jgi:hypothetical protein